MQGKRSIPRRRKGGGSLEGQLLLAMPMMTDRRFARSVVYICAHSDEGAMGLIINQKASNITASSLLKKLGIDRPTVTDDRGRNTLALPIQIGGPVETGRGFVLHTADYNAADSTMVIEGGVCLTATLDILKAIASGEGPEKAFLALGYAGWSPGQLETEIQANGWLHCPADHELIFGSDLDSKYSRAIAKLGIDLSFLVSDAGHA